MNTAEFRGLLRRQREAQRLSQEELGKRANLSFSMISRLESGERDPMPETIGKLATGLALAEEFADRLYLSAGYLPPALIGPGEHDATILRAWRCLRRPLDGTTTLATLIDTAVDLVIGRERETDEGKDD